jgi:hypothetical protein
VVPEKDELAMVIAMQLLSADRLQRTAVSARNILPIDDKKHAKAVEQLRESIVTPVVEFRIIGAPVDATEKNSFKSISVFDNGFNPSWRDDGQVRTCQTPACLTAY